ncbi:MAG TPA: hypothetical protein VHP63_00985 [candidate division Zixibacteria bacterium]|nr:hypothetical protein [candidate division Zixibacteria bacterium]
MKFHLMRLMTLALLVLSSSCSKSPNSSPDGSNGNGNLTTAEYFGIVPGRTINGAYSNYVRDSLRQFYRNSDHWTFTASVGSLTTYNGHSAYPVTVTAAYQSDSTPPTYSYVIYLNTTNDGLYWYGGTYCNVDLPLSAPGRIAVYPLTNGQAWQTIGHAETEIDQCYNHSVADTLNGSSTRLTNVTVRGLNYSEAFLLRFPFLNVPGHIGTRYYEVWLAPGKGPVRGASFWPPDSVNAPYTRPKEGWEFTSFLN